MNLNSLILTNIQGSPYFKVQLFALKTYHEVVDEIYYRVQHLEPWEAGSRKIGGQTGMCGGVRGVGAGGIVSSAFCLLYKLFTLKMTRKQLTGMMNHMDSPYIRGLAFMYARYTLPPADLWDWFKDYLADEEEIDVKAGGGCVMYMGDVVRDFLMKLDWFGALFPRIPVPIQKIIVANMKEWGPSIKEQYQEETLKAEQSKLEKEQEERELREKQRESQRESERDRRRDAPREGYRDTSHRDSRDRHSDKYSGSSSRDRNRGDNHYSKGSDSRSHRSDRDRRRDEDDDFSKELKKAKERVKDERRGGYSSSGSKRRSRSRSRDRKKRSRSRDRKKSRSRDKSREKSSRSRRSKS